MHANDLKNNSWNQPPVGTSSPGDMGKQAFLKAEGRTLYTVSFITPLKWINNDNNQTDDNGSFSLLNTHYMSITKLNPYLHDVI